MSGLARMRKHVELCIIGLLEEKAGIGVSIPLCGVKGVKSELELMNEELI